MIEHGSGLMKREKDRGRLARLEAAVCKLLVHPNIVATYAFHTGLVPMSKLAIGGRKDRQAGATKMVTLLVQEFCSRGTLRDALDEGALGTRADGLSYFRVCAKLMAQVAYGLSHAHSIGVVHADLKARHSPAAFVFSKVLIKYFFGQFNPNPSFKAVIMNRVRVD